MKEGKGKGRNTELQRSETLTYVEASASSLRRRLYLGRAGCHRRRRRQHGQHVEQKQQDGLRKWYNGTTSATIRVRTSAQTPLA